MEKKKKITFTPCLQPQTLTTSRNLLSTLWFLAAITFLSVGQMQHLRLIISEGWQERTVSIRLPLPLYDIIAGKDTWRTVVRWILPVLTHLTGFQVTFKRMFFFVFCCLHSSLCATHVCHVALVCHQNEWVPDICSFSCFLVTARQLLRLKAGGRGNKREVSMEASCHISTQFATSCLPFVTAAVLTTWLWPPPLTADE